MPYVTGFPFRFGPGACCCPGCWWFADDFYRADSTDLGSDWHEVVGDWGIQGWELVEKYGGDGTANSVVMCTLQAPVMTDNGLQVVVTILEAEVGDVFYIYVHATASTAATGAKVITYERLADDLTYGEKWRITIDGGVTVDQYPSKAEPWDDPGTVRAYVCTDNRAEQIKAGVTSLDPWAWDDAITPGAGRYVGLGHDNEKEEDLGARFDDFFVTELRTPEKPCTDCFCFCDTYTVPKGLYAEIIDETDRASCLTTLGWDMDYNWASMGGLVEAWQGDALMPTPGIGGTVTQRFYLECTAEVIPGDPFSQFTLTPEATSPTSGCQFKDTIKLADPLLSSCDPFELIFGPYTMSHLDLSCFVCDNSADESGTFYIRITEAA